MKVFIFTAITSLGGWEIGQLIAFRSPVSGESASFISEGLELLQHTCLTSTRILNAHLGTYAGWISYLFSDEL